MSFEGHQTFKINNNWMFDLTEFVGYRIHLNRHNEVVGFDKAFKVTDKNKDGNVEYTRFIDKIPLGVLRKTELLIKAYYKEAHMYGSTDK